MKKRKRFLTGDECSLFRRILKIMKLTMFILLATSMMVSASLYSQSTRLTLKLNEISYEELFKEIENQTEFRFAFSNSKLDPSQTVNIDVTKGTLEDILGKALPEGIAYEIIDRYVVIMNASDKKAILEIQQQKTISGTVNDKSDLPLPGVSIVVKGSTQGTVTNANGEYSLINVPEDATLVFSFVGMKTQEIQVAGKTKIDVILAEETIGVEEVVVVGYGVQKKINLTGALDVVNAEQISNRSVTNVSEALQGITPNLTLVQTGTSTEAGGSLDINIRGIGSLSGNSSPYILVDGVPMDMDAINPNDIESITVLKDAAASAIYGARAPYGVILITTKKGEMQDKVTFEYSNNLSLSSPIGLPHQANSLDFAIAHNQANANAGLAPNWTEEEIERIKQYQAGEITDETWLLPNGKDWAGNSNPDLSGNANHDWMYIYFDDLVLRQKHDFSIRGGGRNNTYYVSAGYWDQPDELRYGDQFYKRYNLTANLSSQVTKWLRVNFNSKYIKERTQYFNTSQNWTRETMYHLLWRTHPYKPMYLPNGEYSFSSFIANMEDGGKENHYDRSLIVTLGAEIEPIKNWVTTLNYNYKDIQYRMDSFNKTVYGTKPDGSKYALAYPTNRFISNFASTDYQLINVVTSYNKEIDNHYFSVLAGFEQELNRFNQLEGQRNDLITFSVPSLSTATGDSQLDDIKSHWATRSIFGRFNYNYNEKYLIEMNARYDGTSRFEKGSRWGFFPSVSAGYNISKEGFWSAVEPYINTLKFRVSWGTLGNQNVANYLYLPNMAIKTKMPWMFGNELPNYVASPNLISPDLTWETSETKNIGLDAGFVNNRLNASLDVFSRKTINMFGPEEAVPLTLGATVPQTNNASIETKGFELSLLWKDKIGNDFSYNIRATLADNVSKVLDYNNPTKTLSTWYEGQTIGEIWGLTTVGIYQSDEEAANGPNQSLFYSRWQAGDIQYKDLDGDAKITRGSQTADDSGDYSIIGNSNPRFLYGLTFNASWKGFDFNMFWQGVGKKDYAFGVGDVTFFGFNAAQGYNFNIWQETLDYWRPADETNSLGPNTDAYYARPYFSNEDQKNKQIQTRWTQNAAYARLKSLTVGYTLPHRLTQKANISKARFYISGENLLTLTSFTKLIDPEGLNTFNPNWGAGKVHPLRRVYAVGLNVTF